MHVEWGPRSSEPLRELSMRNIETHNGKAKEYIKDARDQLVSLSFES